MTTIAITLALFAVAALGGLTLAILRLRGKTLPLPLALGHGALAAVALVLLAAVVIQGARGMSVVSLIGFLVAALGGFWLFSYQLRKQQLPILGIMIHGVVAVVAFVFLAAAVLI